VIVWKWHLQRQFQPSQRSRQVSTDIALCQDGVIQWLNLKYTTAKDVITFTRHTDLLIMRMPPSLRCSRCGQLGFDRYLRAQQRIRDLDVFRM